MNKTKNSAVLILLLLIGNPGCSPRILHSTLSTPSNYVYPLQSSTPPIIQDFSSSYTFMTNWTEKTQGTYSCTYQTLGLSSGDPNYAGANTPCTSLPSLETGSANSALYLGNASFSNGTLRWIPSSIQRGTFQFTLVGTTGSYSSTDTFFVTVREPYTNSANMLIGLEATNSNNTIAALSGTPDIPRTLTNGNNNRDSWLSIVGSTSGSLSSTGTPQPWTGTGSNLSSPYALTFIPANSDFMTLGTAMNSQTGGLFSAWISPSSATSTGTVILGNGDGSGHGFTLRQSSSSPGTIEFLNDSGTVCQSPTTLSNGSWYFVSGLTYGTNTIMYINGQQACSVVAGSPYSASASTFTAGANISKSNNWAGSLADLKLYGTTNATAPMTAAQIQNDFMATANRFRSTPVEDIVTNGLIFYLDPANANQGLGPYAAGCTPSETNFFELTSSVANGTLSGFSNPCTTDGWQGNGTVSNPYVINFNGSTDLVTSSSFTVQQQSTSAAIWVQTTSSANGRAFWLSPSYILTPSFGSARAFVGGGVDIYGAAVNDGKWHYLSFVGTSTTQTLYVDGNPPVVDTGSYSGAITHTLQVGGDSTTLFYPGSLGPVMLWNQSLSAAQVKQNCLAQEHRFTSVPQSICGAP